MGNVLGSSQILEKKSFCPDNFKIEHQFINIPLLKWIPTVMMRTKDMLGHDFNWKNLGNFQG
jgi:hypothetical protein